MCIFIYIYIYIYTYTCFKLLKQPKKQSFSVLFCRPGTHAPKVRVGAAEAKSRDLGGVHPNDTSVAQWCLQIDANGCSHDDTLHKLRHKYISVQIKATSLRPHWESLVNTGKLKASPNGLNSR